jgi:sRNA-binding protein
VAGEELAIRQQKYHREQQIYENKRLVNAEREEHRWKRDEEAKAAEEAYWVEQRDLGIKVGTVYSCVNLK